MLWFVKILFLLYGLFCIFAHLLHCKKDFIAHSFIALGTIGATWLAYHNEFPFISVPLFLLGVWSSNVKSKEFKGVPLPFLLIMAMEMICGVFFLFSRSTDALHGVVNCAVLAMTLCGCIMLKHIPPISIKLFDFSYIHVIYCPFKSTGLDDFRMGIYIVFELGGGYDSCYPYHYILEKTFFNIADEADTCVYCIHDTRVIL